MVTANFQACALLYSRRTNREIQSSGGGKNGRKDEAWGPMTDYFFIGVSVHPTYYDVPSAVVFSDRGRHTSMIERGRTDIVSREFRQVERGDGSL